ncbi:MAG: M20/M25/M40 family metallo-hydrolase [Opitutaceae bacterium]|nr:M20/M25/M40 family metallo-hydrolase [Opitutaceae bacterium]
MRRTFRFILALFASLTAVRAQAPADPEATLRAIFTEALVRGRAYGELRTLVTTYPGRLAGSKALAGAVTWGEAALKRAGAETVYRQDVMVPHWERGAKESVTLLAGGAPQPLAAFALGGSVATPAGGIEAEVVEVKSLEEVAALGREQVAGKIVFFNRPMDPAIVRPGTAYSTGVGVRSRGPSAAARLGAVAVIVRSMTHALDDLPHTGGTNYAPDAPRIPAAAISTLAAERLGAALTAAKKSGGATVRVALTINSRWLPDAPSHNVIGEIRGTEFPEQIILVGGHLDSWDVTPGAHDNGSGIVQSIEVLRIFRALGLRPRHTLRCVLFTNEENGLRGSLAYAASVREKQERHVIAIETDNGGFQPRGFNLGSTQGDLHERAAARWAALFAPYGLNSFVKGTGGADVGPLLAQGIAVAGLTPDSQRYFDYHHTTADSIDKVHPRELHLGAGALAALVWLVDTQGL